MLLQGITHMFGVAILTERYLRLFKYASGQLFVKSLSVYSHF